MVWGRRYTSRQRVCPAPSGAKSLRKTSEFIAAESLCLYAIKLKRRDSKLETIRAHLFHPVLERSYEDVQKRPIYWLFSPAKRKPSSALCICIAKRRHAVERMRTEYVVPLLARYQANIPDRLNDQLWWRASGGEATRLKRETRQPNQKFSELRSCDDRLRAFIDKGERYWSRRWR